MKKTLDELAFEYQNTGESKELIRRCHTYLMRWHNLIVRGRVNFNNEEIRYFLSTYIRDPELVKDLQKKAKYHKDATIKKVHAVVAYIQKAYIGYEKLKKGDPGYPYDDVYMELVEILLHRTKVYIDKGFTFKTYLEQNYMFELKKKYIDKRLRGYRDDNKEKYREMYYAADIMPIDEAICQGKEDHEYQLEWDEYGNLNNILWLNGIVTGDLYKDLTYTQRFILVKLYQDKLSLREVAKLTGMHHRSVYRIAKKLKDDYRQMRLNGELKWIR